MMLHHMPLLWQVRLSQVELKSSAFDGLALPVRVKRGVIGSIVLKDYASCYMSWCHAKLSNAATKI